jgi:hypothetical protein
VEIKTQIQMHSHSNNMEIKIKLGQIITQQNLQPKISHGAMWTKVY